MSEKDQAYKDAATYYDKAWRYSNLSSPALGKRLSLIMKVSGEEEGGMDEER